MKPKAISGESHRSLPALKYQAGVVAVALALISCGNGAQPEGGTGEGEDQPLQRVTFLLDIPPQGKHAMFFAPLELGYWREVGLDVTIESALGSSDNVSKIASGVAEFGFADTSSLIVARSEGAAVKEVAMIHYKNLMCVNSLEPLDNPSDLEGLTVGVGPGTSNETLFPAFAELNGFDASEVELVHVDIPSQLASLAAGSVDATLGYYTEYPALEQAAEEAGKQPHVLLYADYGLDLYSNGIIVRDDLLTSDPDLVRRFLQGLVRGIVWTVENPDEATQLLVQSQPALSEEVVRAQVEIAIEHLMVPEVLQNGVGPMSEEKLATTLEFVERYFELEDSVSVEDVYTNEFVPKGMLPEDA